MKRKNINLEFFFAKYLQKWQLVHFHSNDNRRARRCSEERRAANRDRRRHSPMKLQRRQLAAGDRFRPSFPSAAEWRSSEDPATVSTLLHLLGLLLPLRLVQSFCDFEISFSAFASTTSGTRPTRPLKKEKIGFVGTHFLCDALINCWTELHLSYIVCLLWFIRELCILRRN